jgi:hypothetical protein
MWAPDVKRAALAARFEGFEAHCPSEIVTQGEKPVKWQKSSKVCCKKTTLFYIPLLHKNHDPNVFSLYFCNIENNH